MSGISALLLQVQRPNGEWLDFGYLHNDSENNWFTYADRYWDVADRPVVGQVFEERGRDWKPNARVALPRWFSHLLPEGRLRIAVARAASVNDRREFQLLRRLGRTDLPGALRAVPVAADYRLEGLTPAEPPDQEEGQPLLKFSLAGAQLKFSVFGDGTRLTVPAAGQAGNYIVKMPDERPGFGDVPAAELGGLELARAIGIPTPEAHLLDVTSVGGLEGWATGEQRALAVKRFDRDDRSGRRIHMEEYAQVLNVPTARVGAKYDSANFELVGLLTANLVDPGAVADVIDRIVLNVLFGNGDAHLKNWAILYPDGRTPILSPAYDVLPTVLYLPDDNLGLKLNDSRDFLSVDLHSFDRLAVKSGFGIIEGRTRALQAGQRVLAEWQLLRDYLTDSDYRRLTERLWSLPLTQQIRR